MLVQVEDSEGLSQTMIKINIPVLRNYVRNRIQSRLVRLNQILDKTFTANIGGRDYEITLEKHEGKLSVFVWSEAEAPDLTTPRTRFKIGEFLLPQAMKSGERSVEDFKAVPAYIEHTTQHQLTESEMIGVLSWVKNNCLYH